jgi:hypothetical protein
VLGCQQSRIEEGHCFLRRRHVRFDVDGPKSFTWQAMRSGGLLRITKLAETRLVWYLVAACVAIFHLLGERPA